MSTRQDGERGMCGLVLWRQIFMDPSEHCITQAPVFRLRKTRVATTRLCVWAQRHKCRRKRRESRQPVQQVGGLSRFSRGTSAGIWREINIERMQPVRLRKEMLLCRPWGRRTVERNNMKYKDLGTTRTERAWSPNQRLFLNFQTHDTRKKEVFFLSSMLFSSFSFLFYFWPTLLI
jgi:hypothetical protein